MPNTLGKYQIVREIARSNDIIYEAIDPTINRRIALKELNIPDNLQGEARRERVERFWREGKAAGRLAHPNIVSIYEVGKDGDRCFIAMEYLEGQNLRDVIKSCGQLSIKDTISYMTQLCAALSYAHLNGVIHRDLKPENVQILPGCLVKLTDFGIARLVGEPSITQAGQVFGTPSYMSPEQVAGKDIDIRSDIFSLGVLLYEMITGNKPFTGDSVVTITYNIMNSEPVAPTGAPPYIVNVIRKAMSKNPDGRYSTVDAFIEDLKNENAGQMGFGVSDPATGYNQPVYNPNGTKYNIPSVPTTPYGTPMPSYGSGSSPNPFGGGSASGQGQSQSQSLPPYVPSKPIVSSETKNFLGVLFLVVALFGMLAFAAWAVSFAYKSFTIATTGEKAKEYFYQGNKLYNDGKYEQAMSQWQLAVDSSPDSKWGKDADNSIFNALVNQAEYLARQRSTASLANVANTLIQKRDRSPEGYYYLGMVYDLQGDYNNARIQYQKAVEYGGNDQYAIAARQRLGSGGGSSFNNGIIPPPINPQSSGDEVPFSPAQ